MTGEPTFSDALSRVHAAIASGDHDRAIAMTDALLRSYPDALGVWRARAQAFDASGRPFQASEAYQRVLDIAPADVDAMTRLALALSASGQLAEAKLAARQALDYAPDDEALRRIVAAPGSDDANLPEVGAQLRAGLDDVRTGLLDRGITRLRFVAAQCPDRTDIQVALAHALWQAGARVAAAEVCQAILDVQPDCLNAHALLLALWNQIGPACLEQVHLSAIERLDPDHGYVKALLGDASPLDVTIVPATRPPAAQLEAESLDRADWVADLVAAASSAPKPLERSSAQPSPDEISQPLERDDVAIASASGSMPETEAMPGDDVVHLDDATAAGEQAFDGESLIPLEWEEADDWLDEERETPPAWLADQPNADSSGFVPSGAPRQKLDGADSAPEHIRPLEWRAADTPEPVCEVEAAAPIAEPLPHPSARDTMDNKAAAAREALLQSRWQEAMRLYEKVIAASRGPALEAIIADLEAVRAVQPATRAVHELLGLAYTRKGDLDAALEAYHCAMALV